jgi:hypothetical protein
MNDVQQYADLKLKVVAAKQWAEMLGKPYSGGGGGIGGVRNASFEIYFQGSNGAQNYHKPSSDVQPYLDAALKESGSQIILRAIELMEGDLLKLAAEARAEYKKLADAVMLDLEVK